MDNNNYIELYKNLEQRDIELKVQIQQLTNNLNTLTNDMSARIQNGEVDASVLQILQQLLAMSNSDKFTEDDMKKCEEVEAVLSAKQQALEAEYAELNNRMQQLLRG